MENLFLSSSEISKAIRSIGEKKAAASLFELLLLGILAGIYISFGANCAIAVSSGGTLDAGFARFLAGSVFSVGLMLVLIPGSELFTGNILMAIGFIYRKYSFWKMLRNWLVVYAGNLAGTDAEHTYCPGCGRLAIRRAGFRAELLAVAPGGRCRHCGADLNIRTED